MFLTKIDRRQIRELLFPAIALYCFLMAIGNLSAQTPGLSQRYALIIGGPGGEQEFTDKYLEQTSQLYHILVDSLSYKPGNVTYLFEKTMPDSLPIDGVSNADNIRSTFNRLNRTMRADDQLAVFMIGHGTFDGEWAKFNIVGPDLRDIDYAELLADLPSKRVIVINTSSSSGPFIDKLSAEQRIVVTATKSGIQHYETNFTDFLLEALIDPAADFNKDKRVSVLEAFKFARTNQDQWFEKHRRLRAEHPLLDDNGDGEGSQELEDANDGLLAGRTFLGSPAPDIEAALDKLQSGEQSPKDKLLLRKLQLEKQIADLKTRKQQLAEQDYNKQLETLLIELAQLNQKIKTMDAQ